MLWVHFIKYRRDGLFEIFLFALIGNTRKRLIIHINEEKNHGTKLKDEDDKEWSHRWLMETRCPTTAACDSMLILFLICFYGKIYIMPRWLIQWPFIWSIEIVYYSPPFLRKTQQSLKAQVLPKEVCWSFIFYLIRHKRRRWQVQTKNNT